MSASREPSGTVKSPTTSAGCALLPLLFVARVGRAARAALLRLLLALLRRARSARALGVGDGPRGRQQHREREEHCANQFHGDLLCPFVTTRSVGTRPTI